MPRCPYCDAEYTPGEISCKSCWADLSSLDRQPVSGAPEPPEALPVFTSLAPQPAAQPDDDESLRDAPVDVPAVPPVPQPPLPPSATQSLVPPSSTTPMPASAVGPVCPSCGMTNEKDSKFCDGCGKPLGGNCPSCQGANRPGAKFCQHCGHRLGDTTPVAAPLPPPAGPPTHIDRVSAKRPYTLVVLNKEGQELARFLLREGVNQIGAKSVGEGILPDVDFSGVDLLQVISRRHAILRVAGDRVTLADCGSTNGTRVDGTKITTVEVPVDERSSIVFGNLHARLVRA